MAEKVVIGSAELWHGDCREVLPTLPKVDAVITDPPYGVSYEGSTTKHGENGFAYESFTDTPQSIADICVPAVRLAASLARSALVTPGNACAHLYDPPRAQGAIFYPSGANSGPWGFVCSQPIFYYGADPYLSTGRGRKPNGFSTTEATDRGIGHPCPKPIGTARWMVARASLEGETVLDPFMGSGTTGVACMNLGRKFIGIEIERKYFDIACERISRAQAQGSLLPQEEPRKPEQLEIG